MKIYKAEIYIDLEYTGLCYGCPFFGGNATGNKCKLRNRSWEAEDNIRPEWCPLQEIEVME